MFKWKKLPKLDTLLCLDHESLVRKSNNCWMFRKLSKQANNSYCSEIDDNVAEIKTKTKNIRKNHAAKLNAYLESNQQRLKLKHLLPDECFLLKKNVDSLYLIDPINARKVASCILKYIGGDTSRIIAECTPGLGLISRELLRNKTGTVRLYEPLPEFRDHLKELNIKYPGKVKLFTKNLFSLPAYLYIDRMDNGNRVDQLLSGIPRRSWRSDPVLTIIGPTKNTNFLRYLARALPMQTSVVDFGRIEMFLMMKPRDYVVLTADAPIDFITFRYITIIFNLFFDYELLEKLPRQAFLPWQSEIKYVIKQRIRKIDEDKIYLVRAIWKKDLPLPVEQLMFFYHFVRQCFGGKTKIVPTLETWVPGCGENVIWPKLQHDDYYEDMGIHTEFGDLNPNQVLGVFKEMYHHPSFEGSPFLGMIESELIKSETVESKSNVICPDLEKNIVEDIEVNLNEI